MFKRFVCFLTVLTMTFPVFAASDPRTMHNESFYNQIIDPTDCLFEVTDALSLADPAFTAEQALLKKEIAPSVAATAQTLYTGDALKTAERLFRFVQKEIAVTSEEDAPLHAADVLAEKKANIHGANNLLLALLHAADLPAIRTVGHLLQGDAFDPNAAVNHAWCEVLIGNQWYLLDLTQDAILTSVPESHVLLRRGPTADNSELYYEQGYRYRIQNGGAQICGVEQLQENLTLHIPPVLGGLPVLSVAEEAFAETEITALTFPHTLQHIGRKAFYHSDVPAVIDLPASVASVDDYAFSYLNGLYGMTVAPNNPAYTAEDGVLYNKDKTTLLVYPHEKQDPSFTVPESVTLLYCTCFSGNPYLTELTLTNPDAKAMTYTFYGCRLTLLGTPDCAIETRLKEGGLTEHLNFLPQEQSESGSLMHFTKTDATLHFDDVSENAWFYPDLDTVYRQGLLLGISETLFGTNEPVTLAQAITMSVRIRLRYRDNATLPSADAGSLWYLPALDQAFENQWFALPDLTDLDRPATRAEFAQIMAGALPRNALPDRTEINEAEIPDLPFDPDARAAILTLYRTGILAGTSNGSFNSDSNITRAEAAAILARLTDVTRRLYFNKRI